MTSDTNEPKEGLFGVGSDDTAAKREGPGFTPLVHGQTTNHGLVRSLPEALYIIAIGSFNLKLRIASLFRLVRPGFRLMASARLLSCWSKTKHEHSDTQHTSHGSTTTQCSSKAG
jgi:hypothetical protein